MKSYFSIFILLLVSIQLKSQQAANLISGNVKETQSKYSMFGVPCFPNVFWGTGGFGGGTVDELMISGSSVVVVNAAVVTTNSAADLAYCNNQDMNLFSPTFYATHLFYTQPQFYDFGVWNTINYSSFPNRILNCGGNGNFLYYAKYDSNWTSTGIVRYQNQSFTPVYNWGSTRKIAVSDLEVDNNGNVWFFTGSSAPGNVIADSLIVVSPSGLVRKKFATLFNATSCYGMLFMNSTLYISFGAGHPTLANKLVPVNLLANSATLGIGISMPTPTVYYRDLAGCNAGTSLLLDDISNNNVLDIYPNPVVENIEISIPDNVHGDMYLIILDLNGKKIFESNYSNTQPKNKIKIDCSQIPQGGYVVQMHMGELLFEGKIVKQ
ncbi:MAG: T9SS type A sorting domain-containing protein [Bacteroidetes bacterium]|nr:T9SS type A sorting domain-containing protein [Bacteroidota bacterium]